MNKETYVAKTFAGLEQPLAEELKALGGEEVSSLRRGVSFRGDQALLYKANIRCRTALSILKPLADFSFGDKDSFYEQMRQIGWTGLFAPEKTISVIATAHDSELFNNTMFLAQLTKDAIVDSFSEAFGRRPDVDTASAHIRIVVNVFGNTCKVSLDSSGEALFKRGYRKSAGQAPINEVLAAGLIMLSGWDRKSPFLDLMCGSGTFAIEAAMMSGRMAPALDRKAFGFSHWNDFNEALLEELRSEAAERARRPEATIIASDIMGKMLDIARKNVMHAGLLGSIQVQKNDFFSYRPREKNGWLILNPPYGHRMDRQDVRALYINIGDAMKRQFTGFKAGIISAELESMKHIGLRPLHRFPVYNGPLKATFNVYELFAGKHKERRQDDDPGKERRGGSGSREWKKEGGDTGRGRREDSRSREWKKEGGDAGRGRREDGRSREWKKEGGDAGRGRREGSGSREWKKEGGDAGRGRREDSRSREWKKEGGDAGRGRREDGRSREGKRGGGQRPGQSRSAGRPGRKSSSP